MRRGGVPSLKDHLKLDMSPKVTTFSQETKATPVSPCSAGLRVGIPASVTPGYFIMPCGSCIPPTF